MGQVEGAAVCDEIFKLNFRIKTKNIPNKEE